MMTWRDAGKVRLPPWATALDAMTEARRWLHAHGCTCDPGLVCSGRPGAWRIDVHHQPACARHDRRPDTN